MTTLHLYVDIFEAAIADLAINQDAMLFECLERVSKNEWILDDTELSCQSVKEAIDEKFVDYEIEEYEIEIR